jgi:phosphoribosyl 1,2-cyclic phosphodiesterase
VEHLCLENGINLIKKIKPRVAVLTHFGMTMIKNKPWEIAEKLEKELKTKVIATSDGLTLDLGKIL